MCVVGKADLKERSPVTHGRLLMSVPFLYFLDITSLHVFLLGCTGHFPIVLLLFPWMLPSDIVVIVPSLGFLPQNIKTRFGFELKSIPGLGVGLEE